jgi:hypothetical protein
MRSLVALGALLIVVLAGLSDAGDGGLAVLRAYSQVPGRVFLRSPAGREFLRHSTHPKAAEWLWLYHREVRPAPIPGEPALAPATVAEPSAEDPTASVACGAFAGTRFNRETATDAVSQIPDGVDFFQDGVAPGADLVVGLFGDGRFLNGFESYAVSRSSGCAPAFEGGLPAIADPLEPGDTVSSVGGGPVAVDPARSAVFAASVYEDGSTTGIGLLRSTRTTLLSAVKCPGGTHSPAAAATCWPARRIVGAQSSSTTQLLLPHIAVDEKTSGTGAGTVYITYARDVFSLGQTRIFLIACTNNLAACTSPQLVSGAVSDSTLAPHVAVRPAVGAIDPGYVTLTWLDAGPSPPVIRYRSCTPVTPPTVPTCGTITSVDSVNLSGLNSLFTAGGFFIVPFPQHDHRQEGATIETYVVWARCRPVPAFVCPDSDVVLRASNNDGATWSALGCADCNPQEQFGPTVRTDRARGIVNVAYYSSQADPTFQHRTQVMVVHIGPGGALPDSPERHVVTTFLNDLTVSTGRFSPFIFGPSFGTLSPAIAARSHGADGTSRTYVHHLSSNLQGSHSGIPSPDPNNHMSRLDY